MKVYAVVCNNGEKWADVYFEDYRHWTDSIHATRDGAERYIRERKERYEYIENRINELEEQRCANDDYTLPEKQMEELNKLCDEYAIAVSHWDCIAEIVEYELME